MVDWTELRVAKLKLLHKEGLAAAAIAKKLGPAFTKSMVIGKIHRLGLNKKPAKTGTAKKLEALVQASSAKAHPRMPAQPPPRSPDPTWSPRLRCPGTWGCRSRADVNYSNFGLVNVASLSGMIAQRACSAAHQPSGRVPGASTISGSSSQALLHPSSGRAGQTPTRTIGPWSDQQAV